MTYTTRILLLGSGELGKEVTISAKRFGAEVIAVDHYANAPAMQVADHFEVIDMLDGDALQSVIDKHQPDFIVPEVEAIRTERLIEFEQQGYCIVPTAEATNLTMNRDAIRQVAAEELGLRTAKYAYAESVEELKACVAQLGFPCVVKPVMSSSGKGQSIIHTESDIESAWQMACQGMRGDTIKIIAEEFIHFQQEITLLTVKQHNAETIFVKPIGHRQQDGDYRESWLPAAISEQQLHQAQHMAKVITDRLGGAGLFGVEFFICEDEVIFSELSPRPHDTGMVTMISQDLSEFDLHVRAIMGLPIPDITYYQPSASAVILANQQSSDFNYQGLAAALQQPQTQIRIFGKPSTRKNRRMGVALASAPTIEQAIDKAKQAADCVKIESPVAV